MARERRLCGHNLRRRSGPRRGRRNSPYKSLFAHARYESADFEQVNKAYADQTYMCDLSAIPVEDSRFDAVLFNQVMEHLPEPPAVLCELHRALRPGGHLMYLDRSSMKSTRSRTTSTAIPSLACGTCSHKQGSRSSGWIGSKATSERWAINGAPLHGHCPGGATTTVVGSSGSSPRPEH